MKLFFKIIPLAFFFLGLTYCSANQGTDTSVGTIVNPVSKPSGLTLSLQTTLSDGETSIDLSTAHCQAKNEKGEIICYFGTTQYQIGIKEMYLANCNSAEEGSHVCERDEQPQTTLLYQGDLTEVSFSETATVFPSTLEEIDESAEFSLIYLKATYIQQTFPSKEQSSAIISDLAGKVYRICTTSEQDHPNEMATFCGNSMAQKGDYLVDLDNNGTVGFLVVTEGVLSESETRDTNYSFNSTDFITRIENASQESGLESSGHVILTGKQRPSEAVVLTVGEIDLLNLLFVTGNSIEFVDSDGDEIYNPTVDTDLRPLLPTIIPESL